MVVGTWCQHMEVLLLYIYFFLFLLETGVAVYTSGLNVVHWSGILESGKQYSSFPSLYPLITILHRTV